MRALVFSGRNLKELLRDPLTFAFSLGFPLILLLLLSAIQANIPAEPFEIGRLAPGMCIFGLCFMTLFSATLVAKDRESSFLRRLYGTPMTAVDFVLGYTLPLVPISLGQCIICYAAALCLGLDLSFGLALSMLSIIPISLFFIAFGLLCGSVMNVKQVGGICGALFTNLAAWLSGIWFDIDLVGGTFSDIACALPFVHAVELERSLVAGDAPDTVSIVVVAAYTLVAVVAAVLLFLRQMHRE